jgi:luciferase-like monooxygenase
MIVGATCFGKVNHFANLDGSPLHTEMNMSVRGSSKQIVDTLLTWEGIEAHPHRFGGTEFRIGKREIGHIHGDSLVDIPFPKKIRDAIVAAGEAQPHHVLPETGWISFYLKQEGDIQKAIDLLKRSYQIALKQKNMA